MEKKWYCLAIDEIQSILKANFQRGLTEAEAKIRLKKFGFNQLPEEKPLSKVKIFFEQLARDPLQIFFRIYPCGNDIPKKVAAVYIRGVYA